MKSNQVQSILNRIFGLISLVIGLALLAVVPILQFLSLGYLVHASGRVAISGRWRDGFVGVEKAAVVGRMLLGGWMFSLPIKFIASLWKDAELVAPQSVTARNWHFFAWFVAVVCGCHVFWACLRGGRFIHFLWPAPLAFLQWLGADDKFHAVRHSVTEYVSNLRLPYYFCLGAKAFLGAVVWLSVPVGILVLASSQHGKTSAFLTLLGGILLAPVVCHLPFLQTQLGRTNRTAQVFDWKQVRRSFLRAPIAFWTALVSTLLFAVPLYLLKIELPPRELVWIPSLLFVVFIWPARILCGWALSRSRKRQLPRHWLFRGISRLAYIPVLTTYVVIV